MSKKNAAVAAPAPMQNREQAVADLTSTTAEVVHQCYFLAGSNALAPDRQMVFAVLARQGLQVMNRLEAAWTPLVQKSPPTTTQLHQTQQMGAAAVAALRTAGANATDANVAEAASRASTHIDTVDSLVDLVA